MAKTCIRIAAVRCETIPGLPIKDGAFHARDSQGRLYYAKTQACSKIQGAQNPVWIANELLYYTIASRSKLQMPFSAILEIDGTLCWGSEYINERKAFHGKEQESGELLRRVCEQSSPQLFRLARALLLDVALLNSDRKPWNMLASANGTTTDLWFFDHDKSLLGDGRESAEIPPGDLGRIDRLSVSDDKTADYLACSMANSLVLGCLTDEDVRDVFTSLHLDEGALMAARAACPKEWVSDELFSRLKEFLIAWWDLLRNRLLRGSPRCYLTHALLKRGKL